MIIENEKRSIDGMICSVFENVKGLIDTNTVMGKPVMAENGAVIIPISKVTLGIVWRKRRGNERLTACVSGRERR